MSPILDQELDEYGFTHVLWDKVFPQWIDKESFYYVSCHSLYEVIKDLQTGKLTYILNDRTVKRPHAYHLEIIGWFGIIPQPELNRMVEEYKEHVAYYRQYR